MFLIRRKRQMDCMPVAICFMSNTPTAFMIKQRIFSLSNYMLKSYNFRILNLILRGAGRFLSDHSSLSGLKFLRVGIFKHGGNL
jgi:hypothetical protein